MNIALCSYFKPTDSCDIIKHLFITYLLVYSILFVYLEPKWLSGEAVNWPSPGGELGQMLEEQLDRPGKPQTCKKGELGTSGRRPYPGSLHLQSLKDFLLQSQGRFGDMELWSEGRQWWQPNKVMGVSGLATSEIVPAFHRWRGSVGFISPWPPARPGVVCSRVWTGREESQHLQC